MVSKGIAYPIETVICFKRIFAKWHIIPVCLVVGQCYRLVVRDRNEITLTILQQQIDVNKSLNLIIIINKTSSVNKVEVLVYKDFHDCEDIVWRLKETMIKSNAIVWSQRQQRQSKVQNVKTKNAYDTETIGD
jgi:hypothetical protein